MEIVNKNLARVKALMGNQQIVDSISVEKKMKNSSEIYDLERALSNFKANVDRKYANN